MSQATGESQACPSLWEQAGNSVKAAAGFVASGFAVVSEDEQERRHEICHSCEFFDHNQGRRRKCGCFNAIKAWVANQQCPIGKW